MCYTLGGLKQEEFILSKFWRLEIWNWGVYLHWFLQEAPRESLFHTSLRSLWFQVTQGLTWFVDSSLQSLPSLIDVRALSHVWLFVTPWTVAHLAPLTMGFSRQESWSVLPFPIPGDLPNPGLEPESLSSPVLAGGFFTTSATWEALLLLKVKVLVTQSCLTLFDPCRLYVLFFLILLFVQMPLFLWSHQ